jgi:hypothetical protein
MAFGTFPAAFGLRAGSGALNRLEIGAPEVFEFLAG